MKRWKPQVFTALFFAVLFLAGLLVSGDYGVPFDEPSEQVILKENMKEYAIQLLGPDSEAARYYDQQGINRISQSIEKDHGISAYYLFAPLLTQDTLAPDKLSTLWHAYTWLWFMAGVLAIYGFCREMGFTRGAACFSALFLYLAPRFFAEGHYNNKDIVLLALTLLTLLTGLRLLKKPSLGRALVFSFAGAMATNTKIVGLMPWGLMGLCAVLLLTAQRKWSPAMARVALGAIVSFGLFYALLTPALWPNPLGYFAHVLRNASGFTRWGGVIIYRGMRVNQKLAPIPRMYLPFTMGVTLPLYTLVLAILGQCRALRAIFRAFRQEKWAAFSQIRVLVLLALTLAWIIPLGYAAIARPLVYNGWRHFYFVYAGIVLLAGFGADGLLRWLGQRKVRAAKPAAAAALCLCFAASAAGIIANHPYQYGYYNLLARSTAATDMELDYWALSTRNAVEMLVSHPERDQGLELQIGSRESLVQISLGNTFQTLPQALRDKAALSEAEDAPYLFSNTTYTLIAGAAPPEGYRVLFTLESYGNTLCTVYEQE